MNPNRPAQKPFTKPFMQLFMQLFMPVRRRQLAVLLTTSVVGLFACERPKPANPAAESGAVSGAVSGAEAQATDSGSQNTAGAPAAGVNAVLSSAFVVDSKNLDLVPAYSKAYSDALDALKADIALKIVSGQGAIDRINSLPVAIGLASPDGASVPAKMYPYSMTIGQLTGTQSTKSGKISKDGSLPILILRHLTTTCGLILDRFWNRHLFHYRLHHP